MKRTRRILVLLISIVSILLIGCQKSTSDFKDQVVVSIDGQDIYLDEMMYHIMISEFQGKLIGSYLGNEANYWESEYETGVTMGEFMKDKVMEDAIKYEIFYKRAIQEGMALDRKEQIEAKETVVSLMNNVPHEMLESTRLNEEDLIRIEEKIVLATKSYQKFVKSLNADEASLKSQINPSDYIEYKIQYLFIPTMKKGISGELIPLEQKEKQKAYETIYAYEEQAQATNDLTSIEIKNEEGIKLGEVSFTEQSNSFEEEVEIVDITKQLKEEEISNVFETSRGYYIIKRLRNTSMASYDNAIKEAIRVAEETTVIPAYEKLKGEYRIKVHKRVWDKVKLGQMTVQ